MLLYIYNRYKCFIIKKTFQHFTFGEISSQTKHKVDEPSLNKSNKATTYRELREIIDSEMAGELFVNKAKHRNIKMKKLSQVGKIP